MLIRYSNQMPSRLCHRSSQRRSASPRTTVFAADARRVMLRPEGSVLAVEFDAKPITLLEAEFTLIL